jgi:hypothetical protein
VLARAAELDIAADGLGTYRAGGEGPGALIPNACAGPRWSGVSANGGRVYQRTVTFVPVRANTS